MFCQVTLVRVASATSLALVWFVGGMNLLVCSEMRPLREDLGTLFASMRPVTSVNSFVYG